MYICILFLLVLSCRTCVNFKYKKCISIFSGDVYKKRVGTLEKRGVNHICAIIKNNSKHMRCIDFMVDFLLYLFWFNSAGFYLPFRSLFD